MSKSSKGTKKSSPKAKKNATPYYSAEDVEKMGGKKAAAMLNRRFDRITKLLGPREPFSMDVAGSIWVLLDWIGLAAVLKATIMRQSGDPESATQRRFQALRLMNELVQLLGMPGARASTLIARLEKVSALVATIGEKELAAYGAPAPMQGDDKAMRAWVMSVAPTYMMRIQEMLAILQGEPEKDAPKKANAPEAKPASASPTPKKRAAAKKA